MLIFDWLFGRPLASSEEHQEKIGPAAGVPVLGLDALASAAYGPEAALTLLIPLGMAGIACAGPGFFRLAHRALLSAQQSFSLRELSAVR